MGCRWTFMKGDLRQKYPCSLKAIKTEQDWEGGREGRCVGSWTVWERREGWLQPSVTKDNFLFKIGKIAPLPRMWSLATPIHIVYYSPTEKWSFVCPPAIVHRFLQNDKSKLQITPWYDILLLCRAAGSLPKLYLFLYSCNLFSYMSHSCLGFEPCNAPGIYRYCIPLFHSFLDLAVYHSFMQLVILYFGVVDGIILMLTRIRIQISIKMMPGWLKNEAPDPGSGWTSRTTYPKASKQFFRLKILLIFFIRIRIRNLFYPGSGMEKFESGTLLLRKHENASPCCPNAWGS